MSEQTECAQLKRFYVTLTWDGWPEGGSYGSIVKASGPDEAKAMVKWEMAESRAAECDDSDASDMLDTYGEDWDCVDCFDLDEFISRQRKAGLPAEVNDGDECACGNCDWRGPMADTHEIENIDQRVYAGEIVPAGQCPECGALVHLVNREPLDYPPQWDDITASPAEIDSARRLYGDDRFQIDGVTQIIREDGGYWIHGRLWVPQAPNAEGLSNVRT